MNAASITPTLITTIINIIGIVIIALGFLIGLKRGMFKASYRLIVTLVIIVGCWIAFPAIMGFICSLDLSQFGNFSFNGYEVTTLKDLFEFVTKIALGLIEQTESGWTTYTGDVVIAETQMYNLIYGVASMVLKLVFMLIIIVLNWTVLRFLFGIIYLIIRPKKKVLNKRGKKVRAKPKGGSRLLGGAIGAFNAIFILFLIFVPLSGIFSMGSDISSVLSEAPLVEGDETEVPVNLSFGGEVLQLSEANLGDFSIEDLEEWTSVYRKSIVGTMFGVKIGEESLDYQTFDGLFVIKSKDNDIKIRKEINTCANAIGIIASEIVEPLKENNYEFSPELLDYVSGESIRSAFTELGNLEFVKVVVPVGMEFFSNYVDGNEELQSGLPEYVDLNELSNALVNVKMDELMVEIGNVAGSLLDLVEATEMKPSELLGANDDFAADFFGKLIESDNTGDATKKLFSAIADVQIIDALNTTFVGLIDTSLQQTLQTTLLLKPRLTVSNDGYIEINGVKSNLRYDNSDLNDAEITLNEFGMWVINGDVSDINGSSSQMKLNFSDVKLSNEIRNLGNVFDAFKSLGITSISSLQAYINGEDADINWDNFTYENLTALFDALVGDPESNDAGVGSKLISSNSSNVYVLLNNFLPNDVRGTLNQVPISGGDLASLTLAAKVLVDSGLLSSLDNGDEIDFEEFVEKHSEVLVDTLFKSEMLTSNMTPICNSLLTMLTSDKIFVIPEDYDWSKSGKEDVKGFLTLGVVMMKYQDKLNDLGSLSDDELDELFDTLGEAMCSELMRKNMNNLINYLNDSGMFGNFKLKALGNDDLWTDDEIKNIMSGIRIFLPLLTGENGESNDLLAKIFQLKEEDIDSLLKSRFLVTNIVENLYEYAQEGGMLEGFLCLDNISKDSQLWYDQIVNGQITTKGELRKLLVNALSLFEGVDNFDDFDSLIEILIGNVATLSNNIGSNDDEIGEISNSIVLRDSLIKLIKSLPEKSNGLIVVNDTLDRPIQWYDNGLVAGELRNMLAAIGALLYDKGDPDTDEDDKVLYDQLLGEDNSDKIGIFLNVSDESIDTILNSIIIVDTFKGYIIEFSEGDNSFLYLRNPEMSSVEWSKALKDFLKAARILLAETDDEGNVTYNIDKLESTETTSLISMLLDLSDTQIETLTKSDIIVDTIANSLLEMSNDSSSAISVPENLEPYGNGAWDLESWRIEERKIIKSLTILLDGDANKFNDLSNNSDDLINMIVGLADEDPNKDKLDDVLESDILTSTIASQIKVFGEGENSTLDVSSTVDYNLNDWRVEINCLIHSCKKLLADDEGKVSMSSLNDTDTNGLFELIINLNEAELDTVLDSVIITDTIAKNIKAFGEGENSTLIVSDEVSNYDTLEWHDEIRKLIISARMVIADEVEGEYKVDISSLSNPEKANDMFNKLIHLKNNIGEDDDELGKVLASVIICDTIANQIEMQDTNHGGHLVVDSDIEWKDYNYEEGELRKILASIGLLFEEDEDINLSLIEADKILNHIMDLENKIGEDDDEVGALLESKVLSDTIIYELILLDTNHGGQLVVSLDASDERWHDYEEGGELKHGELRDLFASMKMMFGDDEIKMDSFSIDRLTNHTHDELITIFTSHILLDTFYVKLEEVEVIYIPSDMERNTSEAVACIESINTLLGGKSLTEVSNNEINMDIILDKSEQEINDLFESIIIKYTISKAVTDVLYDDLRDYFELDYDYDNNHIYTNGERYDMVAQDLENLIFTLQDLDDYGISYQEFEFNTFNNAYKSNGNKVPDSLQRSKLIVHSLSKMMNSILRESINDESIKECINTNITDEQWKTVDSHGYEPFEAEFNESLAEDGELRKVFEVMDDMNSITNANEFDIESTADALHSMNRSIVLHNVIPMIIDNSLSSLDGWMYAESDQRELTVDEWDNEIDLLVLVVTKSEDFNLTDLDVNDDGLNLDDLEDILVLISKSRHIDIESVGKFIQSAINEVFVSDSVIEINEDVTDYLPRTETIESYNNKLEVWEEEADNLMEAVEELRDIDSNTLSKLLPFINSEPDRRNAAKEIGEFLDECKESIMLFDVPDGIMDLINDTLHGYAVIEHNYDGSETYYQDLLIKFIDG